ncbi:MAG: hypothetical protein LBB55_02475, partial [Zoogloeaceae bacterium]|nr:hypothetical protein [Zoogloeaceae bacterium]
ALGYDAGVEYEKELVVAVIDKRKRVVSSIQWKVEEYSAYTKLGDGSLRFDTARYQLAEDVRAFGLVFNSSAIPPGCADWNRGDQLILLVPDGKSLRPVLSLYRIVQQSIEGCISVQVPDAIWEDAMLTIHIENSHTNGFRDLRVTANIYPQSNGAPIDQPRVEHVIFRYDGKRYKPSGEVPWWLDFWGELPGS